MNAMFYFAGIEADNLRVHVGDGGTIRVYLNDHDDWLVLHDRLDCARWMKAIADADALFTRRSKAAQEAREVILPEPAHDVIVPPPDVSWPGHGAQRDAATASLLADETARPGHTPEDDLEPLPPLPQRTPAGPPEPLTPYYTTCCDDVPPGYLHSHVHDQDCANPPMCHGCVPRPAQPDDDPQPGGTIYPDLTPAALAGGEPLESLAPEPEEDKATQ